MDQTLVLVVEDDSRVRRMLRVVLETGGHRAVEAAGVSDALRVFRNAAPDVVLADHSLGDGTALDLLRELEKTDRRVPVVVITGEGSIGLAVEAMKSGAHHFITKPAQPGEILRAIDGAVAGREGTGTQDDLDPLIGESDAIRRVAAEVQRVVDSDGPLLLQGETGTGKTLLARRIHARSRRGRGPFVAVNCAGLSRETSDLDLFGRERGAGPGAGGRKVGFVEAASGGTLFLDEVGDLDVAIQGKLLEVLDEHRFLRVGGSEEQRVDFRFVAATQRDIDRGVAEGTFRRDLFFRVNRLPIALPSLRDRVEDIPCLAATILERFPPARLQGVTIAADAVARLKAHSWPGNLRELRNVLERAVLLGAGPVIHPSDLRFEGSGNLSAGAGATTLADVERSEIERALAAVGFRVPEAAQRLGIPRSTLYQRLKEYGIRLPGR